YGNLADTSEWDTGYRLSPAADGRLWLLELVQGKARFLKRSVYGTAEVQKRLEKKVLKSTEEQELEKRLKMQPEVVEMQRKNEEFKKLALAGPAQPVKKSRIQVTKTVHFHFFTDERLQQHPKNQEEYKQLNFMSELRKHPSSPA
ncbi:hypothetical protein A6R68_01859, partial [Neotoma lepida]